MKKIVIVEDKPWVTLDAVCELQKKHISVEKMVYYPNTFGDEDEKQKLLREFTDKTKVDIVRVTSSEEFVNEMEKLYQQENVIFLMDYELKGDSTEEAEKRINVRYAKYKEYGEGFDPKQRKIWFYTVSAVANVAILNRNFPEHVLPVIKYHKGRLEWKEEALDQILK